VTMLAIRYTTDPQIPLIFFGNNSETSDMLEMGSTFSTWDLRDAPGFITDSGTYSVTPAPEPRSLFLLMPIVVIVGMRWCKLNTNVVYDPRASKDCLPEAHYDCTWN
jgi:hypothetical protein